MSKINKMEVHNYFNQTDNYLKKDFGVRVRSTIVKNLFNGIKNKSILDVGCGNGNLSLQFAEHNSLHMIDISKKMLIIAKKQASKMRLNSVQFLNTSLEDFHSKKKFDVIIAIGLLAHVPSLSKSIQKLTQYLKQDGDLILQFSNSDSLITKYNLVRNKRKYSINATSKTQMLNLINENKLNINEEIQYSILLPGLGKLPNSILYKLTMLTYRNSFISKFGTDFIWRLNHR